MQTANGIKYNVRIIDGIKCRVTPCPISPDNPLLAILRLNEPSQAPEPETQADETPPGE